jgi:hypothetical protein
MPIISGQVERIDAEHRSAVVRIVLADERDSGLPGHVLIRADHHYTPVPWQSGRYSVEFGEKSRPDRPSEGDVVLLRRHDQMLDVAWQWCFHREVRRVLHTPKPTAVAAPVETPQLAPAQPTVLPKQIVVIVGNVRTVRDIPASGYGRRRLLRDFGEEALRTGLVTVGDSAVIGM